MEQLQDIASKLPAFKHENAELSELKPHPKNYREHPDDQIQHIIKSIQDHGIYRNIVVSKDGIILAGHGVAKACAKMGLKKVPIIRLEIDSNSKYALKILIGDNEISHLGERDDRLLTEILKDLKVSDIDGLMGTGFDDMMLANLIYVTRTAGEIGDINEAAEWVGMPEFQLGDQKLRLVVGFDKAEDRDEFARLLGIQLKPKQRSILWPVREREDPSSVKFEG